MRVVVVTLSFARQLLNNDDVEVPDYLSVER